MKNKILSIVFIAATLSLFSSCIVVPKESPEVAKSRRKSICITNFKTVRQPLQSFNNLIVGLKLKYNVTQPQASSDPWTFSLSDVPELCPATILYIKSMGFKEIDPNRDYTLIITPNKIDVSAQNGHVNINLGIKMLNASNQVVFTQDVYSVGENALAVDASLNDAFTKALEQVDWVRIASFLKVEQLAKNEPTKQVEGLGTTALEQTIVRWEIQSRPLGADVFWRVVSKTPDVKSTNNKYLTTTPYEATKTLDIKGLTYQTAGDVRIILRCEKEGYYAQEKEFNVRMVLDQEEISAFFRLVKEETATE